MRSGRSIEVSLQEPVEAERSIDAIDILGIYFDLAGENRENSLRHVARDFQTHYVEETALAESLFDSLKQVVAFQFLHGYLRVARNAERRGLHNLHSWEQ